MIARPKTKGGYREIPVPPQVMRSSVLAAAVEAVTLSFFTAPKGGHWRYEVFYDDRWKDIRDLAEAKGLRKRMTMHGLRHSLLTWLAFEGVDQMDRVEMVL